MQTNNYRRWALIAVGIVCGCSLSAQAEGVATTDSIPTEWTLESCIGHALKHNISVRKGRLEAESSAIDVKTARSAFLPTIQGSIGQRIVNRPWSESSTLIDGDQIKTSQIQSMQTLKIIPKNLQIHPNQIILTNHQTGIFSQCQI